LRDLKKIDVNIYSILLVSCLYEIPIGVPVWHLHRHGLLRSIFA